MDLNKIKEIVNSDIPNEYKEYSIVEVLANDENVIPTIMKILDRDREFKKEISQEMNLLLSKAHIGLEDPKFNGDGFMQKEIIEFYTKYKGVKGVGHCFKDLKL